MAIFIIFIILTHGICILSRVQGICSKCQPSAVTLNRQPWRHVDAIMFENSQLVDRFLTFWRESGAQRCGWLYGR